MGGGGEGEEEEEEEEEEGEEETGRREYKRRRTDYHPPLPPPALSYGTRTQTIVLHYKTGECVYIERNYLCRVAKTSKERESEREVEYTYAWEEGYTREVIG